MRAYILVQNAVGRTGLVAREIEQLEGVASVVSVAGPYDVIAEVSGDSDLESLADGVLTRVEGIDGVTRTVTCVVSKR